MNTITNILDVFSVFGSNANMARAIRVGPSTVSEMKRRRSIPVEYWPRLAEAARDVGRDDVTLEALALISAKEAQSKKSEAAA